ncbi:MAG: hypothetical protein JNL75_06235 [Chitinophagales bacterium]|nr:hypothetical protein [Chitinophagales bacterium]
MIKQILREIVIWSVTILIAWLIWFPIHNVIPYRFLPLGLISFTLLMQFARWFVFYDAVVLFKNPYWRVAFACGLFFVGFVIWSEGQKIVALAENMELRDIMPDQATPVFLKYEQMYNLFMYLRNLLVISNYGTPGVAVMLLLKIIYKSLGMGQKKVSGSI